MAAPFSRIGVLVAAVNAARGAMLSAPGAALMPLSLDFVSARAKLAGYKSRGKGGAKPRHPSRRFVAQDKRDARKARNRR